MPKFNEANTISLHIHTETAFKLNDCKLGSLARDCNNFGIKLLIILES
jgi:hypothetical protein